MNNGDSMTNRTRFVLTILSMAVSLSVGGCSRTERTGDLIVAQVGEHTIPLRDITDYIASMRVDYPSAEAELAAREKYLDRLIEKRLLIIGGYGRALDADIGLLEKVEAEKDKLLFDELYRTQVLDQLSVTEAEVKDAYEHYFDRVQFRHILIESAALGDSVMEQLRNGADFGDMAERFSFDEQTRFRGGEMGRDFEWGEFPEPLNAALFESSVGENVGPIETDFGWHIFQVTGKRELERQEFATLRPFLETRLKRRKENARRKEHLVEIQRRNSIEYAPSTLADWRGRLQAIADTADLLPGTRPTVNPSALSPDDAARVMYRFGAGLEVHFGEFCAALSQRSPYEQPDPADTLELQLFAFNHSLYDILRDEAMRLKLDESDIYKERVREYHETLMADIMRGEILPRGIAVTEEDLRRIYEAQPDSFVQGPQFHVRELLVFDSVEARQLMEQVRTGSSLEELARRYTQRTGMQSKGGDLGWLSEGMYDDIYASAAQMEIGEVRRSDGTGQYSIIQLLARRPGRQLAYEDIEAELFNVVQRQRTDSVISTYLDSIRTMNTVVIHDDVLRVGLGERPLSTEQPGS